MKAKNKWYICLKSIVIASLATLGVFLLGSVIIAALLSEFKDRLVRDVILYVLIMVIYAVFFYRFHMNNRLNTYAEHTDIFDPKKELVAFIHTEGKIIFAIYGIATVVTELSAQIMQNAPQNPIAFATMFCLGPWMTAKLPIFRAVLAFAYSSAVVCLLAVLRGRKIHQQEIEMKNE